MAELNSCDIPVEVIEDPVEESTKHKGKNIDTKEKGNHSKENGEYFQEEKDSAKENENAVKRSLVNAEDFDEWEDEECERSEPAEPIKRKSVRLATRRGMRMEEQLRARALKEAYSARNWKTYEKVQLLNGCRQYGTKTWKRVAECVQHKGVIKDEKVVKAYINREKRNQNYITQVTFQKDDGTEVLIDDGGEAKNRGRPVASSYFIEEPENGTIKPEGKVVEKLVRRNRDAPIEQWLEIMQNHDAQSQTRQKAAGNPEPCNYSSILPRALNWVANNEKHPDPADCGGIDYAEIYRYMATMCEGEAHRDLDMETAQRVSELLPNLALIMKRMVLGKESKFFENYRGLHTANTYMPETTYDPRTKSVKNIQAMSAIPGLNPLGLHPEIVVDRVIPFKANNKEPLGPIHEKWKGKGRGKKSHV